MSIETTKDVAPEVQAQGTRTITFYATRGGKKVKVETDVTTWKDLKAIAKKEGYEVDKLHATENLRKSDLVNDEATLPDGPFTVFMRPKETKSGAYDRSQASTMGYKDLKSAIKEDKEAFGETASDHYGNYTQMTTDQLREKFGSFVPPVTGEVKEEATAPAANVADVVAAVAESKAAPIRNINRLDDAELLLKAICANTDNTDICDRIDEMLGEFAGLRAEIESDTQEKESTEFSSGSESFSAAKEAAKKEMEAEQEAKRKEEEAEAKRKREEEEAAEKERKRAEKEEDDRLAKEAEELARGFKK